VSGLDVNFGLFRGLEINMESLRSVAAGGIAFATPYDLKDHPAKDGMAFQLYNKPIKEWVGMGTEGTASNHKTVT
jgi:paraquat-inducible protein B